MGGVDQRRHRPRLHRIRAVLLPAKLYSPFVFVFLFLVFVLLLVASSPVVVVSQDQTISLGRLSSSSSSPPGSPFLVTGCFLLDSDLVADQRKSHVVVVLVVDHRKSSSVQQRQLNLSRSEVLLLHHALTSANAIYVCSTPQLLAMEVTTVLPPFVKCNFHLWWWKPTVEKHFTILLSSLNDESVSYSFTSSAAPYTRKICQRLLSEGTEFSTVSARFNVGIVAQTLRNVWDKLSSASQSSPMIDVKSRSSDIPPRRCFLLTVSERRRLLSTTYFSGGYGKGNQNPRDSLLSLLGLYGLQTFICYWVLFLGLSEFQISNCSWAFWLVIGTGICLGVGIIFGKSRTLLSHSHSLHFVLNLDNLLTSSLINRSSVRESLSSTPLFKRATFPDRIISDQRLYSQVEKFQTACKRTIGILKAVLSWSSFGKCAITCITHLDPIEEIISMQFEELSLCFLLCILMRFTYVLSNLWLEDATKLYCDYVTDVY